MKMYMLDSEVGEMVRVITLTTPQNLMLLSMNSNGYRRDRDRRLAAVQ